MPHAGDRPRPPRILNPHSVPVVGNDGHLKPVPADRLFAGRLRERFQQAPGWQAALLGDGSVLGERPPAAASVLVPLVQREQGLQVLLTQRTAHLRDHAGQISFPGGRAEPEDADAVATALREAEEEVGLRPQQLDVLGCLPTYTTVTHFVVTPVVALVQPPLQLQVDSFEVAQAFEVPLAHLMDPANHRRHRFEHEGGQRQFLSMPYGEFFIWGATAAMLRNLYHFLSE
jgi:8-oxo-dGTP pyrophosphatase MutT (NUDIX family)